MNTPVAWNQSRDEFLRIIIAIFPSVRHSINAYPRTKGFQLTGMLLSKLPDTYHHHHRTRTRACVTAVPAIIPAIRAILLKGESHLATDDADDGVASAFAIQLIILSRGGDNGGSR